MSYRHHERLPESSTHYVVRSSKYEICESAGLPSPRARINKIITAVERSHITKVSNLLFTSIEVLEYHLPSGKYQLAYVTIPITLWPVTPGPDTKNEENCVRGRFVFFSPTSAADFLSGPTFWTSSFFSGVLVLCSYVVRIRYSSQLTHFFNGAVELVLF